MSAAIEALLVVPQAGRLRAVAIRDGRADDAALLESGPAAAGAIHRGRVVRVMPALRAAFVEIGLDRPALLDIGGKPPEPGSAVTVQIVERASRDAGGDKAARVSRRIALAGRWIVALAGGRGVAWSRRADAARAKALAAALPAPPRGAGLLLRRGAAEADEASVAREAALLAATAAGIAASGEPPPCCLAPADAIATLCAEFAAVAIGEILVGDPVLARRIGAFARQRYPDLLSRIAAAEEGLLDRHGAAEALSDEPVVALAGGGRLTIERTAALVAIDVDSGEGAGPDVLVATNLAAAAEAARQLRLRDLGGVVVIDFIRMDRDASGRRRVLAALTDAVARDRRPVDVLGFTSGGLCELIRGRGGSS